MSRELNPHLHSRDIKYLNDHISEFDDDIVYEDMGNTWRIYIEAAQGKITHKSRCRIKSTDYDWERIDLWMKEHHVTNETMVTLFEMVFHRCISVGTISNIRSGHYTKSKTVDEIMDLVDGEL